MKKVNGSYTLYGNPITRRQSIAADRWQAMLARKFNYNPDEEYTLSLQDNPYLGPLFGVKDIVRGDHGQPLTPENAVIISTIRMGFGHYRIAMAGMSCAR
ncbi:MAG: hypothetical protein FJ152_09565, partial [Firmicutes bacterium]|nr:hypothetical protein [Bacillota bacterium]